MQLKFKYEFLVATVGYKRSVIDILENLRNCKFLKLVIVVNGLGSDEAVQRYKKEVGSVAEFISFPEKGKSKALNFYIKSINEPNTFLLFTDDDIVIPESNVMKYVEVVEANGRGYFYGGGVDVIRDVPVDKAALSLYPASIRGVNETDLSKIQVFLGCNWGAFSEDIKQVNLFNPYFGPGSITGSVGQESQMMRKLLAAGVKPFPIHGCRVAHHAPENYHEVSWLMNRKYREGIQKGLIDKKNFLKTLVRKTIGIFKGDRLRKKSNFYFMLGMLYSLKFSFTKIEK